MLKLLKWAYNLGVKHERQRVAGFLASVQSNRSGMLDTRYSPVFEKDIKEEKRRAIELKQAVDKEIVVIINTMFDPNPQFSRGDASFMFPDTEEK